MAPQTPEARKAASRAAYFKLRQKLYDLKGNACRDCRAETSLEVHHIVTDGRNHKRRGGRYKEYRRLLLNPSEYELLCGCCHQRETMRYVRSFRTPFRTLNEKGTLISEGPSRVSA